MRKLSRKAKMKLKKAELTGMPPMPGTNAGITLSLTEGAFVSLTSSDVRALPFLIRHAERIMQNVSRRGEGTLENVYRGARR